MTAYRAGQRVRVVTELEGVVLPNEDYDQVLYVRADNGRRGTYVLDDDGFTTTVTILSEPRPDEPFGIGAVVEAGTEGMVGRCIWIRARKEPAEWRPWSENAGLPGWGPFRSWARLTEPVVLSEGWKP